MPLYHGKLDEEEEKKKKISKSKSKVSAKAMQDRMDAVRRHNKGCDIYRRYFDKAVVLNENVRQAGPGQVQWRRLLRRVRKGMATLEDKSLLVGRMWNLSNFDRRREENQVWLTCKRFYPTMDQVLEEGKKMMANEHYNLAEQFDVSPRILIGLQESQPEELKKFGSDVYKVGYPMVLAKDVPVMITKNLPVARDWGIVNGSTGKVLGYISDDGIRISHVLVKLDAPLRDMPPLVLNSLTGGRIELQGVWPIPRKTDRFLKFLDVPNSDGIHIVIEHFPLQLAYALTIHKAQGMTVDNAIMDVTGCFAAQMPYVALSRVKTIEGVLLTAEPTLADLNKFFNWSEKSKLEEEFARIEALQGTLLHTLGLSQEDQEVRRRIEREDLQE